MEKTEIDILKEFAKSTNRSIVVKEIPYPRVGIHTTQKYKRVVYISKDSQNTCFYIWFNDPYLKIGQQTIFSGAFIPLSPKIKARLSIRNKYFLDKLNIFSKARDYRIGNEYFDSRVIISGNSDAAVKRLLSKSKIQKQIVTALEHDHLLTISINEFKIDFIPAFMNKSNFAILNRQSWEIDKRNIENIFDRIEAINETINLYYE